MRSEDRIWKYQVSLSPLIIELALEYVLICVLSCVSSEEVRGAVLERLSEASVENNHACLLDACVEAASRYES